MNADEDFDDQRTATWVLQIDNPEIQPYEVLRVDAQSELRWDPVCSQDPPTRFFDEDFEEKLTLETQVNSGVNTISQKIF